MLGQGFFLNLIMPPIGYLSLHRDRRFLFFASCFLLHRLLAPGLLLAFPAEPVIHFTWSAFGVIGLRVIVLIDTYFITQSPEPSTIAGRYPGFSIPLYLAAALAAFLFQRDVSPRQGIHGSGMNGSHSEGDYVYIMKLRDPSSLKRGDVIVFDGPYGQGQKISRIVGMPGERIEILPRPVSAEGKLFWTTEVRVNGQPLALDYKGGSLDAFDMEDPERYAIFEQRLSERTFPVLEKVDGLTPDFPVLDLDRGQYYVLGDNRENSQDSRVLGPIREHQITHTYAYTAASFHFDRGECERRLAQDRDIPECADVEKGEYTLSETAARWLRVRPRWDRWVKILP